MFFKTKYVLDEQVWVVGCETRFSREVWYVKGEGKVERVLAECFRLTKKKIITCIKYGVAYFGYTSTFDFPELVDESQLFGSQEKASMFCKRRNAQYLKKVAKSEKDRVEYLKKFKRIQKRAQKKLKKLEEKQKCTKSTQSSQEKKSRSKTKPTTPARTKSKTSKPAKSK